MADLVTALRRAEGYNNNRERFIMELRARKQIKMKTIGLIRELETSARSSERTKIEAVV